MSLLIVKLKGPLISILCWQKPSRIYKPEYTKFVTIFFINLIDFIKKIAVLVGEWFLLWIYKYHLVESNLVFVMLLLLKECFLYCRNKTFLCEALKQPNRWTRTWPRILTAVFLLLLTTFKHSLYKRKYMSYKYIYTTIYGHFLVLGKNWYMYVSKKA